MLGVGGGDEGGDGGKWGRGGFVGVGDIEWGRVDEVVEEGDFGWGLVWVFWLCGGIEWGWCCEGGGGRVERSGMK